MPSRTGLITCIPTKHRKQQRKQKPRGSRRSARTRAPKKKKSIGHSIGSKLGGALGNFAQKGLGKLFGLGEYQESLAGELGVQPNEIAMGESPGVNSLVSPVSSNTVPQMHIKEGCVRIARREFIATIDIRDAGLTRSYAINPGRRFFPWMHSVARNFQQFQFLGFAAEYVPTSGYAVASTNAALGQVAMCFNYNTIKENFVASWPLTDLAGAPEKRKVRAT